MKKKNNYKLIYLFSFLLTLALLFGYVYQVSSLAQETYLIREYQNKIAEYSREKRNLEYSFLENNSFGYIQELAGDLNFVPSNGTSYITILTGEVVVR